MHIISICQPVILAAGPLPLDCMLSDQVAVCVGKEEKKKRKPKEGPARRESVAKKMKSELILVTWPTSSLGGDGPSIWLCFGSLAIGHCC